MEPALQRQGLTLECEDLTLQREELALVCEDLALEDENLTLEDKELTLQYLAKFVSEWSLSSRVRSLSCSVNSSRSKIPRNPER